MKILRQCAMLYKDTSPEILATHPEYVSASKEQFNAELFFNAAFCFNHSRFKTPKGEVYVPTESPKGELGFLSIVMVQEDLIV